MNGYLIPANTKKSKLIFGLLCFFGLIIMGTGYLANKLVLNKMKQKYAPRILELSEKLLKE